MSCLSYFYFFPAFNFPVYKTDIAKIKFCSKNYRMFKETYMRNSFELFDTKINVSQITIKTIFLRMTAFKCVKLKQHNKGGATIT